MGDGTKQYCLYCEWSEDAGQRDESVMSVLEKKCEWCFSTYGDQSWKMFFGKLVVAQLVNNFSSFVKPEACSHKNRVLDSILSRLTPHHNLPQK
jgi:hypothetical protein